MFTLSKLFIVKHIPLSVKSVLKMEQYFPCSKMKGKSVHSLLTVQKGMIGSVVKKWLRIEDGMGHCNQITNQNELFNSKILFPYYSILFFIQTLKFNFQTFSSNFWAKMSTNSRCVVTTKCLQKMGKCFLIEWFVLWWNIDNIEN